MVRRVPGEDLRNLKIAVGRDKRGGGPPRFMNKCLYTDQKRTFETHIKKKEKASLTPVPTKIRRGRRKEEAGLRRNFNFRFENVPQTPGEGGGGGGGGRSPRHQAQTIRIISFRPLWSTTFSGGGGGGKEKNRVAALTAKVLYIAFLEEEGEKRRGRVAVLGCIHHFSSLLRKEERKGTRQPPVASSPC